MTLTNWRNNGWLVEHKTSPQEIFDLVAVTDRDLTECKSPGLNPDWQLSIAYNAALQAATAALAACGYRSARDDIIIESFNLFHIRLRRKPASSINSTNSEKRETLVVIKLQVEFLSKKPMK